MPKPEDYDPDSPDCSGQPVSHSGGSQGNAPKPPPKIQGTQWKWKKEKINNIPRPQPKQPQPPPR